MTNTESVRIGYSKGELDLGNNTKIFLVSHTEPDESPILHHKYDWLMK